MVQIYSLKVSYQKIWERLHLGFITQGPIQSLKKITLVPSIKRTSKTYIVKLSLFHEIAKEKASMSIHMTVFLFFWREDGVKIPIANHGQWLGGNERLKSLHKIFLFCLYELP